MVKIIYFSIVIGFRLLTEYHSFLYWDNINAQIESLEQVSVSLRSIIHSYYREAKMDKKQELILVSVSLRSIIHSY